MAPRRVSIQRTSYLFLILVICIMTIASAVGIWVLQKNYRTAEYRFESEAKRTLRHAAVTVQNQIAFYGGMLKLLAARPQLLDLVQFGEPQAIEEWSRNMAELLPRTLGTALATPDGTVIGDRQLQHVGEICVGDIRHFAASRFVPYPPVHRYVAELEHFDLFERLRSPSGEVVGVLFVSFKLEVLNDILNDLLTGEQRYRLLEASGQPIAEASALKDGEKLEMFEAAIPGTDWRMTLEIPYENPLSFYSTMVLTDLAALGAIAILLIWMTRHLLNLFSKDIERVHLALLDVSKGTFEPSNQPPAILETEYLLPDIEALAGQLQASNKQLEEDSVTDPLTGLYNRRYFDLLLSHSFEQSKRQMPAHLAIIDLNGFKRINDTFGHVKGDEALQRVATHLRERIRASDTLTRIGGDEFGLILHNMANEMVERWMRRLVEGFDAEMTANGPAHCVDGGCTLSIGVTVLDAHCYKDAEQAFAAADQAMYRAKQTDEPAGRSRIAFSDALDQASTQRTGTEPD